MAFAMRSNELRDGLIDHNAMKKLAEFADVVDPNVLSEFESPQARVVLEQIDALITSWGCPPITASVLAKAPRLSLIAHAAGSVKAHVGAECWERGIRITTAAQGNAVPVAEFTLAAILLAGKNVMAEAHSLQTAKSSYRKNPLDFSSGNSGGTVGIIGASRIGRLVCDLLQPFDLKVYLADPTISEREAELMGATLLSLPDLMRESRVVSLHAPILPSTLNMIGAQELALLRDGGTFINTARGVLVDHSALRAELVSGRISAVLDVTEPEPLADDDALYGLPNVLLTPHIAGSVGNELHRLGDMAVGEVIGLANGLDSEFSITAKVLADMA